jgi:hypothetical protein
VSPIRVGSATVTLTPEGAYTVYDDGPSFAAHPHDVPHTYVIAHRCGYQDDILRFTQEHEVCHHIVSEWILGRQSLVIRPLARGLTPYPCDALLEETLTQTFQRWLRANELPIIGDVDWSGFKARALALLN